MGRGDQFGSDGSDADRELKRFRQEYLLFEPSNRGNQLPYQTI